MTATGRMASYEGYYLTFHRGAHGYCMISKNLPLFYAIIAVFTVGLCWGIIIPVTSVILEGKAIATPVIGLMASAIFIGMALGSPGAGKLIERFGIQPVLRGGLCISGFFMVMLAIFTSVPAWIAARCALGISFGAVIISSEVLINRFSSDENRGRNLGLYAFAFSFSLMITPIALWLVTFGTGVPFIGGALACFAAALFMRTPIRAERDKQSGAPSRIKRLVTRISLSLLTNFIAGFMEGSLIALIPLYTLREGFTASQTGMLLSAFMIGHGGAPPFIGLLADRIGLKRVLAIVYMLGFAVFMVMVTGTFGMNLALPLLLAGMSVGALYPLAVGIIGERLPPEDLPRGNAMITACYGMGSILGPLLPSIIMHVTAPRSLFIISAFLYMVVLILMKFKTDAKSANGR
jgi:MFS family permease